MMINIALVYPSNNKADYKPNRIYEPSSLLGIYNILKTNSNCLLIDCVKNNYTYDDLIEVLRQFDPDFLLLSVYDVKEIIEFNKNTIKKMRLFNPNIKVIVGGPGAIHAPIKIANILDPDYLIKGEAENYFSEFIRNFNPECMDYEFINDVRVITPQYPTNIDNISYERDYSFSEYDNISMPNLQRGCGGHCIYCTGCGYTKIRYKSPKVAVDEIEYLKNIHKIRHIMPLGPDFTVMPDKALDIIRELNNRGIYDLIYVFVVRLDSLYKSISLDKKEWNHFFEHNNISFQIGIESFSEEKLIRLGKYFQHNKFASIQYDLLEQLLDNHNILINSYFILIDFLSTKEEIVIDIDLIVNLLKKYPYKFIITGKIINYLELYENTKAIEQFGSAKKNNFVNKLIRYADKINNSNIYSKKLLVTNDDYLERSQEQVDILQKFKQFILQVF